MEENKELPQNTIQKATVKNDRCAVSFKENYRDANYTNKVDKECDQIIHNDMRIAFSMLVPFLITITEQAESGLFNSGNIGEDLNEELQEKIAAYSVTGYVHGGTDESAGVSIIGQKLLKTGQVLNVIAPFTKFEDENYPYGSELLQVIERCDYEVAEYLFNGKFGIKQAQLDFDTDAPADADIDGVSMPAEKKRKKRASKKEKAVVFDNFA
ncbi:hypothetical protein [Bacteroides sp. 51]|uniref:hypothetical protein n=1 Tax=Bacteroides sp. 51 TaxID=2302938 RepID=UPI0013D7CEDE|nr:hypothetical protein [Bacteroides sp. 51]NDV81304.1 hypothetical protein [Bacteroides sp. 51]